MTFTIDTIPGLETTGYIFEKRHEWLCDNLERSCGPNIGRRGENLTICILSLNRSSLTSKLLTSLGEFEPDFAGEVLIMDNGSMPDQLDNVEMTLAKLPFKSRVVRQDKNYGVAGGRNRAVPFATKEWILFLDNDLYLISEFVEQAQTAIAQLGCHFLNVPLLNPDRTTLFSLGGHLYAGALDGEVHLGAGSVSPQVNVPCVQASPFLSTFVFGGASMMRVETFVRLGCFDDNMFIGFEDLDFSIRVFRAGLKVGNLTKFAFVHDHKFCDSATNVQYERTRFSRDILKSSAEYFHHKHGIRVWSDGVDQWLLEKERSLLPSSSCESQQSENLPVSIVELPRKRLPRIALITDTDDWAFANISKQIVKHLSNDFEFEIIASDQVDDIIQVMLTVRDADLVHIFWRETARILRSDYFKQSLLARGFDEERFRTEVLGGKIFSTCVYDHANLMPEEITEREELFNEIVHGYYVSSNKLKKIYDGISAYRSPLMVLPDGVECGHFVPMNLERFGTVLNREIVVGWCGNSKWGGGGIDYKGLHTILNPALEELRAEGLVIRGHFADRSVRMIPHQDMPKFYSEIDVYVCPSLIEGTPNPVLEAMSCGVPVISTDVGIVEEAFGEVQKKFILPHRSVEALKSALKQFATSPGLAQRLSSENLQQIAEWDWSVKVKPFKEYFKTLLGHSKFRATGDGHTAGTQLSDQAA